MAASSGFATCDRSPVRCATCQNDVSGPDEAFTGDVCPRCRHFVHPTRLSRYENLELVKRGGMGAVYRAQHPGLGTVVAIKLVHTETGPDTVSERFDREAKLAAKIPHPGVVRVFDADCRDGRLYLVMEFVDGRTLRECLREGPCGIGWSLDVAARLADVLHAAHEQGIVHRDVKPENVMVDRCGNVRVLDFGISRLLEDEERLPRTGEILGTPEYLSPEQILDVPEAVDPRTDIHAVGIVLYELLTGKSPFAGQNLFQTLKYVESLTPDRPSAIRPAIPEALDRLVLSALAKDKNDRPADAASLARSLREMTASEREPAARPARRRRLGLRAAALLVLGLGLGWLLAATIRPGAGGGAAVSLEPAAPTPAAHFDRGLELKRSGAWLLAMDAFGRARDAGHEGADREWRIVWVYVNRLYPALLDGPLWLAERAGGFAPGREPFEQGLHALAENEWRKAEALLVSSDAAGIDRAVLIALCRHLLGSPVRFEAGATDDAAARLMDALLASGDERIEKIQRLRARIDRLASMRYFLGMAVAKQRGDPRRLSAESELALVAGDSVRATSVFLACRVLIDAAYDARYLLALSEEAKARGAPGITVTRCWLALAAGDAALLRESLLALPEKPDPALARFQALRTLARSASDPDLIEKCRREMRIADDR